MSTIVSVLKEVPGAYSLKERSAIVLGTKSSLSAANVFQYCKAAISPTNEVSEAVFADAVSDLESDSPEYVPLVGKWASLACLPVTCSRNNCPARPDAVRALIKGAIKKRNSIVVIVAPKEHFLALVAAVVRSAPPPQSWKTGSEICEHNVLITCVQVAGGSARGVLSDDDCSALTHAVAGIRLAQRLVDAPPNIMNTDAVLQECHQLAACAVADGSVSIQVIRGEALRDQGFGGLWNVGMAGPTPPALVVLSYEPSDAAPDAQTICWVGKGIVYDTGGLSIKGKTCMPTMKRDMGGAAAVLGAFSAATQIGGKDKKLRAVLAIAENSVDSLAYRPDDIIRMLSGKTVEVNNTDAEGRLVLADACHYAADALAADLIIDMATLTGAQVTATGKKHAALLSNDLSWEHRTVASGLWTGEMLFPAIYCPELFMEQAFTSQVADMKNSADDRNSALSSCAGHFIEAHLPKGYKGPWIHVDMAALVAEGELATGWGVMLFLNLFGYVV